MIYKKKRKKNYLAKEKKIKLMIDYEQVQGEYPQRERDEWMIPWLPCLVSKP